MTVRLALCAALVAAAALTAQEPARVAAPRGETMRPQIRGTHGIVAAGRHYSVAAGIRTRAATRSMRAWRPSSPPPCAKYRISDSAAKRRL